MNKLQKILGAGVISLPLLLGGCDKIENVLSKIPITHIEYSNVLQEDAEVVDVVYSPSRHGSGAGPSFGMDMDGNPTMGLAVTSVSIPEKYAVVFKCQHGKFIVEGTDNEHKDLWERMVEGQDVDVTYKEIYEATYKDLNNDGKRDLVERKLVKYDFLNAQPKGEQK